MILAIEIILLSILGIGVGLTIYAILIKILGEDE